MAWWFKARKRKSVRFILRHILITLENNAITHGDPSRANDMPCTHWVLAGTCTRALLWVREGVFTGCSPLHMNLAWEWSVSAPHPHMTKNIDIRCLFPCLSSICVECRCFQGWALEVVAEGCLETVGWWWSDCLGRLDLGCSVSPVSSSDSSLCLTLPLASLKCWWTSRTVTKLLPDLSVTRATLLKAMEFLGRSCDSEFHHDQELSMMQETKIPCGQRAMEVFCFACLPECASSQGWHSWYNEDSDNVLRSNVAPGGRMSAGQLVSTRRCFSATLGHCCQGNLSVSLVGLRLGLTCTNQEESINVR